MTEIVMGFFSLKSMKNGDAVEFSQVELIHLYCVCVFFSYGKFPFDIELASKFRRNHDVVNFLLQKKNLWFKVSQAN